MWWVTTFSSSAARPPYSISENLLTTKLAFIHHTLKAVLIRAMLTPQP